MTRQETHLPRITRRSFLGGAAGLTFAVALGPKGALLLAPAHAAGAPQAIGAWVRIAPDDSITIVTPAAEMGQGSMTGVPVALAEELDADWSKVTLEMAPAEPGIYGYESGGGRSMGIYGSRAVMMYFEQMRLAGAQVRKVLLEAAARHWGVDAATLATEPNVVVEPATGRRLTYGEIAAFAQPPASLPSVSAADLKPRSAFRIIGKAVPRHDIPAKVDGSAQYSIDVRVPGMVYASTVHSPVQLARPLRWNDDRVRALPGIVDVVALEHGVAVVGETFEQVLAGRRAIEIEWSDDAPTRGFHSEEALDSRYESIAADHGAGETVARKGDVDAAFAGAARVFKASYRSDYGYHAQMEPLNAVARFDAGAGTLEVWEGTQAPGRSRAMLARALGIDVSNVIHHQQYLGGGFGRRSLNDYTIEAALVSRATGRPVKMIWTREEDLAFGMFRPQALQCVEAAMDDAGRVAGWRHCVVGDGGRLLYSGIKLDAYYRLDNQLIETRGTSHGIRLKHWRAVAHPFNVFAIEGLVDEMAAGEGLDPFEFRRSRVGLTPKAARVFDAVERMCDWNAPRRDGRALGLSVSERSGSLGAGVVEISLDRASGTIRVHKVWVAVDGGIIVQPEMARRNIESGVIYGLSSVLKERATVRNGAVEQSNFHDYEVLRISEAPEEIHVEFVSSDAPPTGLGEIGNPFIAAAVANAFHALTGKRLYHMPFTPARVRAALEA
ncbi:MAG: molybdopterin cofactor-binding domain-containing protein [Gammaproteobacteria bacterium]|nr:molybdopterin cofactor-binding domain-containing protein [Gammaproteobacteria bacterium]